MTESFQFKLSNEEVEA